jgi:hypothetical protein
MSQQTTLATDGTALPLDILPVTLGYTGSNLTTLTVTYASYATGAQRNFVQTLTYTGSNLTNISRWVAQ